MSVLRSILVAALACTMTLAGAAMAQSGTASAKHDYTPKVGQIGKDVVWVPTSQAMVDRMLDMAKLTPRDRLVDLGSGDGVTVITAAKRGAKARGIEFNPDLVALARRRAKAAGVADRASFERADIFESDFSEASVVTLFLLPALNLRLRPILLEMAPGTRIVSNSFDMGDWEPDGTAEVTEGCATYCHAMLWIVPARVAGMWSIGGRSLEFAQSYQKVGGVLRDGASMQILADGRMDGARIRFTIGGDRYVGQVDGGVMRGTVNGSRPWRATKDPGS
ncbi:SAM-dependent methyltransferase [Luteimonas granuli]|uniref:Methyltransferase domain-containing protein n=1 Tax=Luteimonas granuli TaxID=1176533 RepID=A0A518N2H0_9GAMM|nr:methyltransferase domain-containing protein [Luteimonas granuli]QDW66110.1 methyltransferase domain-containing protein [Luteimonas granuli]